MDRGSFEVVPIGRVESPLTDPASAPKQGHEGAPDSWLVFEPGVAVGLADLRIGDAADRPNPIGLHRVEVMAIEETRVRVRNLEAVAGTPIVDVKPVLTPTEA